MEQRVREVIDSLDDRGAWVTHGALRYQKYEGPLIDMALAVQNLNVLAEYLAAARH